MSRVSTLREGVRDNPLRLLLLVRSVLVILPGCVLAYGYGYEIIRLARGHFPLSPAPDISRNSLLLALIALGIVAEFTSYRVARVLNPGFYTAWVLWLTFLPWEHGFVVVFYVFIAALSVSLWWLYSATSPQRLRATDAA